MTDAVINMSKSMSRMLVVQKEILKVMQTTKPVVEATTKAMDSLGESMDDVAKKSKDADGVIKKTFIGKIIGDSESGFFRKTTGKTGFFHRMMYGVDGYFIFKNRLDGLLSFIDNTVVKPLSGLGDKKDGFMSRVLMGVKEDYDKAANQISLVKEQFQSMSMSKMLDPNSP